MASLDLRSLYLYLVCLISLVLLLVGSLQLVRHGLNLLLPDPPMWGSPPPLVDTTGAWIEQQQAVQEEMARLEQQRNRRQAVRGLIVNLTLVVLSAGIYRAHWRKLQT
jgi:hypothetical protein